VLIYVTSSGGHRQVNYLSSQKALILEFQAARSLWVASSQIDLAVVKDALRSVTVFAYFHILRTLPINDGFVA
jgi:hypothetical protein